jgi:pimeloyl-ACP methyl ester carboxylesterase
MDDKPRTPGAAGVGRRAFLAAASLTAGLAASPVLAEPRPRAGRRVQVLDAQRSWTPVPSQAPARPVEVDVGPVKLTGWDTGGSGEAVVLLHPATGSAAIWGYQQPELVRAGYRVIAYSRRGHGATGPGPRDDPGFGIDDLEALTQALGVQRFHLVGSAAGGFLAPDYALSYPRKLLSMTLTCTQSGVVEPDYLTRLRACLPPNFSTMPASFRELGPSYRAGYPEGTKVWEDLERTARPAGYRAQKPRNRLLWAQLEQIRTPSLLLAAAADLYAPAPLMLEVASHISGSQTAILSECGHSGYWEQPKAFNAALIAFLRSHRGR